MAILSIKSDYIKDNERERDEKRIRRYENEGTYFGMINDGVQILVRETPTSIEILICQPTAMAGKRKNAVI
jgi:hypothetical protein